MKFRLLLSRGGLSSRLLAVLLLVVLYVFASEARSNSLGLGLGAADADGSRANLYLPAELNHWRHHSSAGNQGKAMGAHDGPPHEIVAALHFAQFENDRGAESFASGETTRSIVILTEGVTPHVSIELANLTTNYVGRFQDWFRGKRVMPAPLGAHPLSSIPSPIPLISPISGNTLAKPHMVVDSTPNALVNERYSLFVRNTGGPISACEITTSSGNWQSVSVVPSADGCFFRGVPKRLGRLPFRIGGRNAAGGHVIDVYILATQDPPQLNTTNHFVVQVENRFSLTIENRSGAAKSCKLAEPSPDWVSASLSEERPIGCQINGFTPKTPGDYTFRVLAENRYGVSTAAVTINLPDRPELKVSWVSLDDSTISSVITSDSTGELYVAIALRSGLSWYHARFLYGRAPTIATITTGRQLVEFVGLPALKDDYFYFRVVNRFNVWSNLVSLQLIDGKRKPSLEPLTLRLIEGDKVYRFFDNRSGSRVFSCRLTKGRQIGLLIAPRLGTCLLYGNFLGSEATKGGNWEEQFFFMDASNAHGLLSARMRLLLYPKPPQPFSADDYSLVGGAWRLPDGEVKQPYSHRIVNGGTGINHCAMLSGSLPLGLRVHAQKSHCMVSGLPFVSGTNTFTVYLSNANAATSATFSIHMAADQRAPTMNINSISAGQTEATIVFTSNESGQAWVLATTSQVVLNASSVMAAGSTISICTCRQRHVFQSLASRSDYVFYVLGEDEAGNQAPLRRISAETGNLPPIANAGSDQTVLFGSEVILNAQHSYDPDGSIAAWSWRQRSGELVLLQGYDSSQAVFFAPDITSKVEMLFEIDVLDDSGASSRDSVKVRLTMPSVDSSALVAAASSIVNVLSGPMVATLSAAEHGVSFSAPSTLRDRISIRPWLRSGRCESMFVDADVCTPALVDDSGRLLLFSGRSDLWWTLSGNRLTINGNVPAAQTINVLPLLNLEPYQRVLPNSTATITGRLNGKLRSEFTLSVPLRVLVDQSGAELVDRQLQMVFPAGSLRGAAQIRSGSISGDIVVGVPSSGGPLVAVGEDIELSRHWIGVGESSQHRIEVVDAPMVPKIEITFHQNSDEPQTNRLLINNTALVNWRVTGTANDILELSCETSLPGLDATQCQVSNAVGEISSTQRFLVSQAGDFWLRLAVRSLSSGFRREERAWITVGQTAVLAGTGDSDHDGVLDQNEFLGDSDGDRIPDWADALNYNASLLPLDHNSVFLANNMQVDQALVARLGETAEQHAKSSGGGVQDYLGRLTPSEYINLRQLNVANLASDYGVIDVEIDRVALGSSVTVVFFTGAPLDEFLQLQALNSDQQWITLDNTILSIVATRGESGICPGPKAAVWSLAPSLSEVRAAQQLDCLRLRLRDGAAHDRDAQANGVLLATLGFSAITRSIGAASSSAAPTGSGGGCSVAAVTLQAPTAFCCSWLSWFLLWGWLVFARRQSRDCSSSRRTSVSKSDSPKNY